MADARRRGRLIAVDGVHGARVADAATALYGKLTERHAASGVSRWDASGLFSDVASAPVAERDVSPRTLMLLYAADLAFRIRWEIGPALEQGLIIVAAPYITTAVGFGLAAGLPHEWLRTLFNFAPPPARTLVLRDRKRKRPWKRKPELGLGECCTTLLEATSEGFRRKKTHAAMVEALASAAHKRGGLVRKRDLNRLADAITARRRQK